MKRAPTERTEGIKSFAVGSLVILCSGSKKTVRLKLLLYGILDPSRLQQRGRDIDGLYRPRNATRPKAASRRRFDDQRNVYRRVVNKKAVLFLAVVTQRLAVIAEQDD